MKQVNLTENEWDWVLDSISESISIAAQNEDMWKGRSLESSYREEKELYKKIYKNIKQQIENSK